MFFFVHDSILTEKLVTKPSDYCCRVNLGFMETPYTHRSASVVLERKSYFIGHIGLQSATINLRKNTIAKANYEFEIF